MPSIFDDLDSESEPEPEPEWRTGDSIPAAWGPCPSSRHRLAGGVMVPISRFDYNDYCPTCTARKMLRSDHDHLHLHPPYKCETPGINGESGVNVKCKCGSYHH